MSKTSQRKMASYQLGYEDGEKGYQIRWIRHPFLSQYKRGHREGLRAFVEKNKALFESGGV